eukprot:SM000040S14826  [mRNA]  locus=s40:490381:491753:- [translate_table: standard]
MHLLLCKQSSPDKDGHGTSICQFTKVMMSFHHFRPSIFFTNSSAMEPKFSAPASSSSVCFCKSCSEPGHAQL